jgi:hypothetical protein
MAIPTARVLYAGDVVENGPNRAIFTVRVTESFRGRRLWATP